MSKQTKHDLNRWLRAVGPGAVLEALAALERDSAVFAVDRDRNVVFWSEGAERLLGWRQDEIVGEHCLKANRCQTCMTGCGIAANGAVFDVPLTLYASHNQPVKIRKTAYAFFDADGTFAGGLEILRPDTGAPRPKPPQRQFDGLERFHKMVSRDPAMHRVFEIISQVAATEGTVLIRGESGTGKELVARALHAESHRSAGPFVAVNCAALSPALLESELFGHVKGAFTGAVRDREGVFARAHTGTLFLDEVAELPLELQAKLLRVIQERSFVPVGGGQPREVDVRLVSATHRALRREVEGGRFREDLMYRLRVIPIYLPPLRERRGDIELLLHTFIERHNASDRRQVSGIAPDAMKALLDHRWPGNVRELQNVVEYAFAVGRGPQIQLAELPPEFREPATQAPATTGPRRFSEPEDERAAILEALEASDGHVGQAAERLGMSRPTFWRKRRKYGI